ncbi:MAG: hypothetical protein IJD80_00765, partial [Oscillospiraceae bacterium]|nr:hypothetical protein [Oscillospiraceae bacterium]
MKKLPAMILAAVMCISFTACGTDSENETASQPAVENTEQTTEENTVDTVVTGDPYTPQVQDIVKFFEGLDPYKQKTDEYGNKYVYFSFTLEGESLVYQYVDMLSGGYYYNLDITAADRKDEGQTTRKVYHFTYEGNSGIDYISDTINSHIAIAMSVNREKSTVTVIAVFADGIEFTDGYRVELPEYEEEEEEKEEYRPVSTPAPTPTPVDRNKSVVPEFSVFLNRYPTEEKDRYYGGNRKYYKNLPLDTQETVVSEVLSL